MRKLLTPVVHRAPLDGLNAVRPLVLADEIKRTLDIPVLDSNPVNVSQIPASKFLRSDNNGSVIYKNENAFSSYLPLSIHMGPWGYTGNVNFIVKVYGVLWNHITQNNIIKTVWCNPDGVGEFQIMPVWGNAYIPFVGTQIFFHATKGVGIGEIQANVLGFLR